MSGWPDAALSELAGSGQPNYGVTATERLCAGYGPMVLFGGWAMAATADAAESWSSLRMRSMSTTFLFPVVEGEALDLSIEPLHSGRRVTHATVTGSVDGRLALFSVVTLGSAGGESAGWRTMPNVQEPESCHERSYRAPASTTLTQLLDIRVVPPEPEPGGPGGGSVLLWARLRGGLGSEATLAVLSDHVPYLAARTFESLRNVATVSSTVRITGRLTSDWVLLEAGLVAHDRDYAVGVVVMWDQCGTVVGTAEQTVRLVREIAVAD